MLIKVLPFFLPGQRGLDFTVKIGDGLAVLVFSELAAKVFHL